MLSVIWMIHKNFVKKQEVKVICPKISAYIDSQTPKECCGQLLFYPEVYSYCRIVL